MTAGWVNRLRRGWSWVQGRVAEQEARNARIWEALTKEERTADQHGAEESNPTEALIELALEAWSLTANIEGWVGRLEGLREKRARSRLQWMRSRLVELLGKEGITLQDLSGQQWDEGDAVEVLNPTEPEEGQRAVISTMVEPIVIRNGRVARRGKVTITLKRGDSQ